MVEQFLRKRISGIQSIYSPKLKGFLYEQVDKDKVNGIGRLYMQLRYPWLNSFLSKNQQSTIHQLTKTERLAMKIAQ